jgi:hypothetical protein
VKVSWTSDDANVTEGSFMTGRVFTLVLGVFKEVGKKKRTYVPIGGPIHTKRRLRAMQMMRRLPTEFSRLCPISSTEVPVEGHPR